MVSSAYWYHMQYVHGICAGTGKRFTPPLQTRIVYSTSSVEPIGAVTLQDSVNPAKDDEGELSTRISQDYTADRICGKESEDTSDTNLPSPSPLNDLQQQRSSLSSEESQVLSSSSVIIEGLCHACHQWQICRVQRLKRCSGMGASATHEESEADVIGGGDGEGSGEVVKSMNSDEKSAEETVDAVDERVMSSLWFKHAHKCHVHYKT